MTCSSCSGASPAMPDRPARGRRRVSRTQAVVAAFWLASIVLLAALIPSPARGIAAGGNDAHVGGGAVVALAPPRETCAPNETRLAGGFNVCSQSTGGGGFDFGGLALLVGIIAGGGLILLLAAFVILRRTSVPMAPADPGEWWTCRTCGKTNVLGSARCYACGTWQS
jgi:uncharacterized membrane protein